MTSGTTLGDTVPIPNRPLNQTKYTEQNMGNTSFDEDFGVNAVELLGYDGQNLQRKNADALATKVTTVGSVTYIAIAAPGTAQATATWQCTKYDYSVDGTIVITFAGGGAFNQAATDLTANTYV